MPQRRGAPSVEMTGRALPKFRDPVRCPVEYRIQWRATLRRELLPVGSPSFRCDILSVRGSKPQGRDDCCGDNPRAEPGRGHRPHSLHVVCAVRETDGCRSDAGDNETENETADQGDAPSIAAFHGGIVADDGLRRECRLRHKVTSAAAQCSKSQLRRRDCQRRTLQERNWQRFPFLTGDVAVTGSPSAISPELSGSIVPCLRPSLLKLARIDLAGLAPRSERRDSSWMFELNRRRSLSRPTGVLRAARWESVTRREGT